MALAELHYKSSLRDTTMTPIREEESEYFKKERNHSTLLKRIPLKNLMDLKVDYAFKQLFGNEKNKDITVVFLNAILQRTGRNRVKDISFKNTEFSAEYVDDKPSRLDLHVVTEADERINVEIQFTNKYNMVKRSLFYWSRLFSDQLQKGVGYKELRPVITINILNFDAFPQTEHFHTSHHLYEDEDRFKLTDVMELHFIEMGKLLRYWKENKLDPWNNALAKWLLLLGMVDSRNGKIYDDIYHELEVIALKDESLQEAFHNWEELSMDQDQREAYEARFKRIMDEEAFQRNMELLKQETEQREKEIEQREKEIGQREKEIEQRVKETAQRAKEAEQRSKETKQREKENIARRLLEKDMEIDFVADSTGLGRNEVIAIKNDM